MIQDLYSEKYNVHILGILIPDKENNFILYLI